MNWKIEQHKRGNGTAEIQVSIMVKDMKDDPSYDAETFVEKFKNNLQTIPKTNSYSAEFSFKASLKNRTSLEIWKMKTNGDYNYKMFTITRVE